VALDVCEDLAHLAQGVMPAWLRSGRAAAKFLEWVAAQGGDARQVEQGLAVAPASDVRLASSGFVRSIDPLSIGQAAMALGAGRAVKDARVNPRVGVQVLLKVGDAADTSVVAARVYGETPADREAAARLVRAAVVVSDQPVPARPAVLGQMTMPDGPSVGSGY
jgi:pyrimidine-nucleoside phosphorylase